MEENVKKIIGGITFGLMSGAYLFVFKDIIENKLNGLENKTLENKVII